MIVNCSEMQQAVCFLARREFVTTSEPVCSLQSRYFLRRWRLSCFSKKMRLRCIPRPPVIVVELSLKAPNISAVTKTTKANMKRTKGSAKGQSVSHGTQTAKAKFSRSPRYEAVLAFNVCVSMEYLLYIILHKSAFMCKR